MYCNIKYEEIREMAIEVHDGQPYGEHPYIKHLDDVVGVLKRFGYDGKYVVAAFFHDAMEDQGLKYKTLESKFGEEVAEMVYCVTDEMGRNRKEKKQKTLPKTASNPDAVIIKLADRIANVEMGGKIRMYVEEHSEFKSHLYTPGHADEMWEHLEFKLFSKN
jgi:(p)ppGpp synthase/HD superfamily hydrolase